MGRIQQVRCLLGGNGVPSQLKWEQFTEYQQIDVEEGTGHGGVRGSPLGTSLLIKLTQASVTYEC